MRIAALYRYPVKGLSPQPVAATELATDGYFPGDRMFALENGPSGFDASAPAHQPKIKFLMLMRNARLAELATRYDDASGILTILRAGREVARGDLRAAAGRAAIEMYLTEFCGEEVRGKVRLLEAPRGFRFADSKSGFVSLINLESVAAIGASLGRCVDPLRFRGNLYFDGLEAFREAGLVGRLLSVGAVQLEILKMIDRCAATGVEPGSGRRDMDVVEALRSNWGHIDCGVYARVVHGGRIAAGDAVAIAK
ncbi:MAG: MOSC domain-containing protein [Methylocystis sp.]|nr:MOSC domain-containing protein [Methylocystis sp.]